MAAKHGIEPSGITKPIQLLSAWLIGLILVNASYLSAAGLINEPQWIASALVIGALLNVPIFLGCLFLLQTKFRPEMQEDSFYAIYLEKRFSKETGEEVVVEIAGTKERSGKPIKIDYKQSVDLTATRLNPHSFAVHVNDLLENLTGITSRFRGMNLDTTLAFGSTSADSIIPERLGVAVPTNINPDLLRAIISALDDFGLDFIAAVPPDEGIIYVGAYTYKYAPERARTLTEALRNQILDPALSQEELEGILIGLGLPDRFA